ncbi:MAG: DJ-1/PfpI family protein [Minisyncoccales bacterium]
MLEKKEEKKVVMVIAFRNFRDIEYFLPKEILERNKIKVISASNKKGMALGADGGTVEIDFLISEVNPKDFEAVLFVGGPGCLKHLDNEDSYLLAQKTIEKQKILGAICISPVILAKAGVLKGKKATVWSSPFDRQAIEILKENGANFQDQKVLVDGKIITANGPNAAQEFGQTVLKALNE